MRLLLPIILLIAAIGLFVLYTNPTYQHIQSLSGQLAAYNDALAKSQDLLNTRDALLQKRNTFSSDDITKLQEILPDNIDNIRLIIDINNIAARHNLSLSKVNLGDVTSGGGSSSQQSPTAVATGQGPVGSVQVGFSIQANYNDFLAFLQDLEHSLRLIDVQKISFQASQGDLNTYDFIIQTYWLH